MKEKEIGTLSVVSTPIGNLGDITLRALETLKQADAIVCEDTRVTSKLLTRYDIRKPLLIYHARSAPNAIARALMLLAEGKHIILVTDAGTPGVSDPGTELVEAARRRLKNDVRIETIPGPSALTAALAIAGLKVSSFVFLGFLPHKKGRQTLFKGIVTEKRATVFYESPHRIIKALEALARVLPERRRIAVCRELTKIYEETLVGSAHEIIKAFIGKTTRVRGEFVVIVEEA